jgi:hypothetical protein
MQVAATMRNVIVIAVMLSRSVFKMKIMILCELSN